ncbi:MAG: DNA polymerase III subunit beta [Dehalococcoidia bacterium]|nr:DNA polymerase III subunit beta [Dehalococcoidia bacterium]MDD5648040.1 DNA polymerase III subunit beta [Dehalococcoidia bacterium]
MKLSCLQENLNKGLGIIGRAVASRTTLPITQNVLIATDESQLKLAATNLEIAISCWVGAKIESEGSITIPARVLTEFVASLPSDVISLNLKHHTLELKSGRYEARINGLDAADFPPIPQVGDGFSTKVKAEDLKQAISQVAFAAATEESRPVLTGVQTEFEGSKLTMAAADGFRLAVHRTELSEPVKEKVAMIIPAKAYHELSRLMGTDDQEIEITLNTQKSQVLFKLKGIEMVSQLIQGTFPNYSQLIPQTYGTKARIDVAEFLRAIKMAAIFARDGSGIARVIVTPGATVEAGKITISARADEIGDNVGEIDALVDGEAAKIAFNARYLADVLSVVKQAQVSLEVTTPSNPGVIRPVGVDNYDHVVMPMFVQW